VLQSFTWFPHHNKSKLSTVKPAFNAISRLHILLQGILHQFNSIFLGAAPISSCSRVFRDVSSAQSFEGLQCLQLWGHKVQEEFVCHSSAVPTTTQPTVHSHIPEDLNPQQHHRENFISCTEIGMTATASTVNNCNLRQLEKWAFADVCTLTF
jgi:hypothetical protein